MSTKIYNGYRLPALSLKDLIMFSRGISSEIIEKRNEIILSRTAKICSRIIDCFSFGLSDEVPNLAQRPDTAVYLNAQEFLLNRLRESHNSHLKDPLNDVNFAVSYLVSEDCILAMLWCQNKKLIAIWESQKEVEPYPYWNNTDPLEGYSWEEWEKRGKQWEEALGDDGYNPPAIAGLLYEIKYDLHFPFLDIENSLNLVPSDNDRAPLVAFDLLFRKQQKEKEISEKDFVAWIKSDGKKTFEDKVDHVKKNLIEITKEKLLQTVNDFADLCID